MHFINGELDMESNQQLATHFLNKTHAPHDKNDLGYISATSFTCSNFNHRFVDEIARWSNFIQTILLSTTGNFPNCARWHGLNLENGRFFYTLEMEKSATSYLKAWVGSFDLVIFDCLMYMAYISRMWSCTSFFFQQTILAHFMPLGTVRGFAYYIDSLERNMAKETHYVFQTSHVYRTHLLAGNWRGSKEMKVF